MADVRNLQVIPLTECVFCVDCLCMTNSKGRECENCRSIALLNMGTVMGKKRELEPIFDKLEQN